MTAAGSLVSKGVDLGGPNRKLRRGGGWSRDLIPASDWPGGGDKIWHLASTLWRHLSIVGRYDHPLQRGSVLRFGMHTARFARRVL